MPLSDNRVSGSQGISVLMANSLMFQRSPQPIEGYDDPQLSNFYGQALPFLKRGVPVNLMHIENVGYKENWKDTKILLMSYSNMKPLEETAHQHIADWVKAGGTLVYSATDKDAYQSVLEWWNQGNKKFTAPSQHLFSLMNLDASPAQGEYKVGKGTVYVFRVDPKDYIMKPNGDTELLKVVQSLYAKQGDKKPLEFKNNFYLSRGAYELASVLEESVSKEPLVMNGNFIDLFDPNLPVLNEKVVLPGQQAFLFNLAKVTDNKKPQVLCGAARVYDEVIEKDSYRFVAKSPIETNNVMRVMLPTAPKIVTITDHSGKKIADASNEWDEHSKTCLLRFENHPDGVTVAYKW